MDFVDSVFLFAAFFVLIFIGMIYLDCLLDKLDNYRKSKRQAKYLEKKKERELKEAVEKEEFLKMLKRERFFLERGESIWKHKKKW